MFHVWIVITFWDCDGGAIKGVFTSQKEAEKHVFYLKSEKGRTGFDDIIIEKVATDRPVDITI
jgi:hypothetical protein